MALPKLHSIFYRQQVFTFEEARRKLKLSAPSLYKMLHELVRDGYLVRIKKTIYAVVPVEAAARAYTPNKYLVAAKLQKKSYLGYHTALELNGVAESSYNTVYINVPKQAKSFRFQETTYSFVTKYDSFGLTKIKVEGIPITVSDREKTILDGIDRLKYVGGLEEYLKSVSSFPSIDISRLIRYLKLSKKKALYAKAGWLLSLFSKQWFVKQAMLDNLRKHLSNRTFYLQETNGSVPFRFDRTWNLMVPENVEGLIEETPA